MRLLSRLIQVTLKEAHLPDIKGSKNRETVRAKMCISFLGNKVFGIKVKEIAKALNCQVSLIYYYMKTYPEELRINKKWREITERVKGHRILTKKYFEDICMEKLNLSPKWNVWISGHRFLCQLDYVVIDPDLNKDKINAAYKEGLSCYKADLIELNDSKIIWKIVRNMMGPSGKE